MKITDLQQAKALDYLYLRTPIGSLIERYFDVTYLSGDGGVFMEINERNCKDKEKK